MAIKLPIFKSLHVEKEWKRDLYDDSVLGLLLRRAQLRASFVPWAIVRSSPHLNFGALVQEGKRHFFMLRIAFIQNWVLAFVSVNIVVIAPWILFSLIHKLELSWILGAEVLTVLLLPLLCFVIMQFAVSTCENLSRLVGHQTIRIPRKYMPLAFIVPFVIFIQILVSVFGRTVEWQGIIYEVLAYNETRVIKRKLDNSLKDVNWR
jgi:hypothetical protein